MEQVTILDKFDFSKMNGLCVIINGEYAKSEAEFVRQALRKLNIGYSTGYSFQRLINVLKDENNILYHRITFIVWNYNVFLQNEPESKTTFLSMFNNVLLPFWGGKDGWELDVYCVTAPNPVPQMIQCMSAMNVICCETIRDWNGPYTLSMPVLRVAGSTPYISCFATLCDDIDAPMNNQVQRPNTWILADIATGRQIAHFDVCQSGADFSEADFNSPCPFEAGERFLTHGLEQLDLYNTFDQIRAEYLMYHKISEPLYSTYLDAVKARTPISYHRFYDELSNIDRKHVFLNSSSKELFGCEDERA